MWLKPRNIDYGLQGVKIGDRSHYVSNLVLKYGIIIVHNVFARTESITKIGGHLPPDLLPCDQAKAN